MTDVRDYSTLSWIKGELDEIIAEARGALADYVEGESGDRALMEACAEKLHQVHATLKIVEVYGAAMLAEEMEQLARAIGLEEVRQSEEGAETLMLALIQLPDYLEKLQTGEPDIPLVLLPLINDLRTARGGELLSEAAFFHPSLRQGELPPQVTGVPNPELRRFTRKLRAVYQQGLVRWYRGLEPEAGLGKLRDVVVALESMASTAPAFCLFQVTRSLIEGLLDQSIDGSNTVKQLLAHFDRQMKLIQDNGEGALAGSSSQDLVKNLLYYVARAESDNPLIREVQAAYNLEQAIPSTEALSAVRESLSAPSLEMLKTVHGVIKDDLLKVKDSLDLYIRRKGDRLEDLLALEKPLRTIADTLGMLGRGALRRRLIDEVEKIHRAGESGDVPEEEALMDMAGAILFVESSLEGQVASRWQPREDAELVAATMGEVRAEMARAKDAILRFVAESENPEPLKDVPAWFHNIAGALRVLEFPEPAEILDDLSAYLKSQVLATGRVPDRARLEALADGISSIEYFAEALVEGRGPTVRQQILATARAAQARLDRTEPGLVGYSEVDTEGPQPAAEPVIASSGGSTAVKIPSESVQTEPEAPPSEPASATDVVDPEILQIFLEEAREELEVIREYYPLWKDDPDDQDSLATFRRSFHTLKGSGRLVGAAAIGEYAWSIENLLNRVIDGAVPVSPEVMEVMDSALAMLPVLIDYQEAGREPELDVQALSQRAFSLSNCDYQAETEPVDEYASLAPAPQEDAVEGEPGPWVDSLTALEEVPDSQPVAEPPTAVGMDIDSELLEVFLEEAREEIGVIREYLPRWKKNLQDLEALRTFRRSFHTLKGSGRLVGAVSIGEFAWSIENLLNRVLEDRVSATQGVFGLLDDTLEILPTLIDNLESGRVTDAQVQPLVERAQALASGVAEAEPDAFGPRPVQAVAPAPEEVDTTEPATDAEEPVPELEFGEVLAARQAEQLDVLEPAAETEETVLEQEGGQALGADEAEEPEMVEVATEAEDAVPELGFVEVLAADEQEVLEVLEPTAETEEPALGLESAQALAAEGAEPQEWFESAAAEQPLVEPETAYSGAPLVEKGTLPADAMTESGEHIQASESIEPELPAEAEEPLGGGEKLTDARELEVAEEAGASALRFGMDPVLYDIFESECREHLKTLADLVDLCHHGSGGCAIPEQVARAFHTLHGSAHMAQVEPMAMVGSALEHLVNELRLKAIPADDRVIELINEGQFILNRLLDSIAATDMELPETDHFLRRVAELQDDLRVEQAAAKAGADREALDDSYVEVSGDPELLEIFLEEARDLLEMLDASLREWRANPAESKVLVEMQRTLHTLKGGARLAGIMPVGDLSHAYETLLSGVVSGEVKPSPAVLELAQDTADWLSAQVEEVATAHRAKAADSLIRMLEAARAGTLQRVVEEPPPPVGAEAAETFEPRDVQRPHQEQIRVRADLLDRLVNNAGEVSIYRSRIEQQSTSIGFHLAELEQTVERLRTQLRQLEIETETQILFRFERDRGSDDLHHEFDPLEMDRFSTMQQLSRSLMETVNDLVNIKDVMDDLNRANETLLLQQSRVATDLQDGLLRTRMVPFSQVVPRLHRLVRQTAKSVAKQAALEVYGANEELDRNILERMLAPLEHILRNAVSHGIESAADRRGADKPETGRISLYVGREGTDVLLNVVDDGAGMNLEAIRRRAIERGLLKEGAEVSDDDVLQFVLTPGFSTAAEVTQVAGRGVGMDVVASGIKQLGGSLEMVSQPGRGTSFTIRLPLTLAISEALLAQVAEEIYAIPYASIEGVVRIGRNELQDFYSDSQSLYSYAGHDYQVRHLGGMLGTAALNLAESVRWFPVLLVRSGERRVALQVDGLLGNRQIVVKSVGPQLSSIHWITGATILGDGRVALILDLNAMIRMDAAKTISSPVVPEPLPEEGGVTVMVVDDSITVRKVTARLLERHNMTVISAKDGMDAVTKLQERLPDIMLLDIEMPRMDGFEVARHMRNTEELKHIPVIMITSRSGEKHRKRALELGVQRYLGKPYQETELLDNIYSVLSEVNT